MTHYKFRRYGTLLAYSGPPTYVKGVCITPHCMAWWWPWNWAVLLFALSFVTFRAMASWERTRSAPENVSEGRDGHGHG